MSDRQQMAKHYAERHVEIDPGVLQIWHLPAGADDREIRLLEENGDVFAFHPPQAIDFVVDVGHPNAHKLVVVDVTPDQMAKIRASELSLPSGWSLEGSQLLYQRNPS